MWSRRLRSLYRWGLDLSLRLSRGLWRRWYRQGSRLRPRSLSRGGRRPREFHGKKHRIEHGDVLLHELLVRHIGRPVSQA